MPVILNVPLLLFTAYVHLTLSVSPQEELGEPSSESDPEAWWGQLSASLSLFKPLQGPSLDEEAPAGKGLGSFATQSRVKSTLMS